MADLMTDPEKTLVLSRLISALKTLDGLSAVDIRLTELAELMGLEIQSLLEFVENESNEIGASYPTHPGRIFVGEGDRIIILYANNIMGTNLDPAAGWEILGREVEMWKRSVGILR